jgi:hypothetical protein
LESASLEIIRDEEGIMEVVYARCAGLDVHKKRILACVRVANQHGSDL